jgi:hypothetical protein
MRHNPADPSVRLRYRAGHIGFGCPATLGRVGRIKPAGKNRRTLAGRY